MPTCPECGREMTGLGFPTITAYTCQDCPGRPRDPVPFEISHGRQVVADTEAYDRHHDRVIAKPDGDRLELGIQSVYGEEPRVGIANSASITMKREQVVGLVQYLHEWLGLDG